MNPDSFVHWFVGGLLVLVVILGAAGCLAPDGSEPVMCGTGEFGVGGIEIMERC